MLDVLFVLLILYFAVGFFICLRILLMENLTIRRQGVVLHGPRKLLVAIIVITLTFFFWPATVRFN